MTAEGKTPVFMELLYNAIRRVEKRRSVLTAYAADQEDDNWEAVRSAFVDGWKTEYELTSQE